MNNSFRPYSKEEQLGPKKEKSKGYIKSRSKKGAKQVKTDEQVYEEVWNRATVKCCENCGQYLGEDFRDFEGRVNDKRFYSHILTKGGKPEMRLDVDNFNLLCPDCHDEWEFGDQTKMNIWHKNKKTIQKLKEKYYHE
jgi:hypothetical protein